MAAAADDPDLWALRALGASERLRAWMFDVLAPTAAGPMLEVGAGIGTFSRLLLEAGADPLLLLEPEAVCAGELRAIFAADPRVQVAEEAVPEAPTLAAHSGEFAYALCQNVLEHVEDDAAGLAAVTRALRPGGELAVLVPAHPRLYGRLDRRFGHFRRYTPERLRALLAGAGAEVVSVRSFNLLGVPGWWLAGRTGLIDLDSRSLRVYEALVRAWRPLEDALRPPAGLSLVARARMPD